MNSDCLKKKIKTFDKCTILFTGDSITDSGRQLENFAPLGNGYVHFAANLLLARHPQRDLEIINTGISGNTSRDLKKRWNEDCLLKKPDILSILIGVNDLWRRFEGPQQQPNAVYPPEFESNYRYMLEQVSEKCKCKLVLIEPFMFCSEESSDQMRQNLNDYIVIVRKLANEFSATLIPLQELIAAELGSVLSKCSKDKVHPAQWAHAWIAQKWLACIE
jgi:lysophospholipase L1-like esterase